MIRVIQKNETITPVTIITPREKTVVISKTNTRQFVAVLTQSVLIVDFW